MARLDKIHFAVKNALIKDGWTITAEPLHLVYGDVNLEVDLAAEPVLGAEKNQRKIAVEIKSFLDPSLINDLKITVGQYEIYLAYLKILEPERKLFVAVGQAAWRRMQEFKGLDVLWRTHKIPFIIVNLKTEEITEWTN